MSLSTLLYKGTEISAALQEGEILLETLKV